MWIKDWQNPWRAPMAPPSKPAFLKHIFFNSLSLQNTAFSQNNSILKAPTREETLIYFANKRSSLCFTVFFNSFSPTPPFLYLETNVFFPQELKAVQKQDHTRRRRLRRPALLPPPALRAAAAAAGGAHTPSSRRGGLSLPPASFRFGRRGWGWGREGS